MNILLKDREDRPPLAQARAASPVTGDLSDAQARASERRRRATLSAAMAMAAKLVSVATALITVPLTLHYLGPERYGMWMIMSSLLAMLSFADLGIGNGILNTVAAAHGRDDIPAMREGIASGLAVLSGVALCILAVFAVAYPHLSWHRLFNVGGIKARAEAGPAIAAFVICFAAAIPATVVQRVETGLQRGFLASAWLCAGSMISLALVLAAVAAHAGLPVLTLAFLGGPLLANALNSLVFFGWMRRDMAPRLSAASRTAAAKVMRTGLLFLLLQITTALIFNADSVIIAQVLGPAAVPQYSVPDRLFSLVTMCFSMALAPLWPAYREALSRGDHGWARSTLRRSVRLAVGAAVALALSLGLLARIVIHHWVGAEIVAPALLIAGFVVWKVLEATGYALGMFLNGAHVIRQQVLTASATALASIALEILLVGRIGVAGAIWAKVIAYGLFTLLPYAWILPSVIRRVMPEPAAQPAESAAE